VPANPSRWLDNLQAKEHWMSRTDRLYRVEAIVIRRRDWGEADRLLTVYSREQGKIQAVAKGARKPTSRKAGHIELFTRTRMLIARTRSIDIVTQAETLETHHSLRESLEASTLAHYFAELLDRFTGEAEADQGLFNLLSLGLTWLCEADDLRLVSRYYELHLLDLAGFRPELHRCASCSKQLEAEDSFFSPAQGGVLCSDCGPSRREASALSLTAFKVLRYGQTHDWNQFRRLRLTQALHAEVENVMQRYLFYVLERNLKSVDFLRQLRREAMIGQPHQGERVAND
jgi:DNA repair protein RecO (recombination protein O)